MHTIDISSLSLHDALPILDHRRDTTEIDALWIDTVGERDQDWHREHVGSVKRGGDPRSEEHTSELQSLRHLVCRLLLEKKNLCIKRRRRHTSHQPTPRST